MICFFKTAWIKEPVDDAAIHWIAVSVSGSLANIKILCGFATALRSLR